MSTTGVRRGAMSTSVTDRVDAMLRAQPIVDGHNDLPWAVRELADVDPDTFDFTDSAGRTQTDLARLQAGRVGAQFWSVWVPQSLSGGDAVVAVLEQIDFVRRLVARFPADLALASTAEQVSAAIGRGQIACLLGAEGGHSIAGSLGALRVLFELGVRYLTLTHNENVPWADSATDVPALGGLNDFGRVVVREMNQLGMLVDLSHVSPGTMRAALDVSTAPVLFSHSSCRELVDHARNVPDEILARLPDNGGVCLVTFVAEFVSTQCNDHARELDEHLGRTIGPAADEAAKEAETERFLHMRPRPHATIAQVADHVEHVREIAGVAHVGIGGDYDGCPNLPDGLGDVSGYPALFTELVDRGWRDEDCKLVAGANALRVLRDAEHVGTAP